MLQIFLQLWRFNSSGSIFNILPLQAEGARWGVPRGEIRGGCGGSCWGHGAGTAGCGVTRSQRLLGGTRGGAHGSGSSQFLVLVSLQTPAPRAMGSRWALPYALQAKKTPKLSRNFPWMCPLLAPHVPAVLLCCHRPHRAHEGMDGAGESPGRICTKGSGAWMWLWHGEDTEPGLSPGCQGAPPRPRSNARGAAGGKGRGWEMAREDEQVGNKWGRLRSCVQGGFGAW